MQVCLPNYDVKDIRPADLKVLHKVAPQKKNMYVEIYVCLSVCLHIFISSAVINDCSICETQYLNSFLTLKQ